MSEETKNKKNKLTPITCNTCGKRIRKGMTMFRIRGYIFTCCSAECLLYAATNHYEEESPGYEEFLEDGTY